MIAPESLARARAVADAVLYEGYLLYPYRATSPKNRSRWQFGVLGPPGATAAGVGEDALMSTEFLLQPCTDRAEIDLTLRFLQLQRRAVERAEDDGTFTPATGLTVGPIDWLSWDEAVECEVPLGTHAAAALTAGLRLPVRVDGGSTVELLRDGAGSVAGRVLRTRRSLQAEVRVRAEFDGGLIHLAVEVENACPDTISATETSGTATARSLIGAHLMVGASDGRFVSLLEPPGPFERAAATCRQHRCFPVLAGCPGESGLMLVSPIILYDYPEVAEQSTGALFDATEIDEILHLRVMTLTDEEKAQARATDPLAAAIIDRCDDLGPAAMARLHGTRRDPPHDLGLVPELSDGTPWWDPEADTAVRPEVDGVLVEGVRIAKGSVVRLRPSRRADAQDLFYGGRTARVATVHGDVDGAIHVGVTLIDDPAAELHDWYGRYLYFAPDELEPLEPEELSAGDEEGTP
ncbi:hypothetical protein [Rhodococcus sp. NPDC059234]|uniref:hypothetical protein n=1 Tax=Rhodococcus sp. NPDC059234 TaxID=3346781 RepID=UPI00366F5041